MAVATDLFHGLIALIDHRLCENRLIEISSHALRGSATSAANVWRNRLMNVERSRAIADELGASARIVARLVVIPFHHRLFLVVFTHATELLVGTGTDACREQLRTAS